MSKISDRDSKMEVFIRKALFANGFRFRKNDTSLPGKPDIVLPKYKTIIFTHGCFWHGHEGCKASKLPESRRDFWGKKIKDNIERDKRNISLLERKGWKVIVLWQCELNNEFKRHKRLATLISEIQRTDTEINQKVYELYGLTEEEKQIIQASLAKTVF